MECESHILVIDDEEDLCWVLENVLRSEGFTVTSVNNGKEALACLTGQVFEVVFVDAKLPELDGLTLAAMIRKQSPQTSIILISGFYYQEDQAITEGIEKNLFNLFLAKPFDLEDIRLLARQAVAWSREMKSCLNH